MLNAEFLDDGRHVLGKGETLSELAAKASKDALEMAGVSAKEIDMVILCTSSPDDLFGSACAVRVCEHACTLMQGSAHMGQTAWQGCATGTCSTHAVQHCSCSAPHSCSWSSGALST